MIPDAWRRAAKGENVRVAVLDTGVFSTQTQLLMSGEFVSGASSAPNRLATHVQVLDESNPSANALVSPETGCSHGTRIAATIVAPLDGRNIVGVAYRGSLITVRTNDDVNIQFAEERLRKAINAAALRGADIVEIAMGSFYAQPPVNDLIDTLIGNIVFVAAAGTTACPVICDPICRETIVFPAKHRPVVAVTGYKWQYESPTKHDCTCMDPEVDVGIFVGEVPASGRYTDEIQHFGGSSQTSAVVAGIAALIKSKYPAMTADEVRARLFSSTGGSMKLWDLGYGAPDAHRAVGGLYSVELNQYPASPHSGEEYCLTAMPKGDGPFEYRWSNGSTNQSVCTVPGAAGEEGWTVTVTDSVSRVALNRSITVHVDCVPANVCDGVTVVCGPTIDNCGNYVDCGNTCGPAGECVSNQCVGYEEP